MRIPSSSSCNTRRVSPCISPPVVKRKLPPSETADSIRVFLRFRDTTQANPHIKLGPTNQTISWTSKQDRNQSTQFNFANIFLHDATQAQIFESVAQPVLSRFQSGFNGGILAYGQSGTGKTYTMEGKMSVKEEWGIIPRILERVFSEEGKRSQSLKISLLEIYREQLKDLLVIPSDSGGGNRCVSPNAHANNLKIREKVEGGSGNVSVYVENLLNLEVESATEALHLYKMGLSRRAVGETALNTRSSRSHTILTIHSVMASDDGMQTISLLHLVDLAGSERSGKLKAEGTSLEEGKKINLSLTTLGNVINALSSGNDADHVPYRDSKLTRILQTTLGGNSMTHLICTLSGAVEYSTETLSTLSFGARSCKVVNQMVKVQQPVPAEGWTELVENLRQEILRLKTKLASEEDEDRCTAPHFGKESSQSESSKDGSLDVRVGDSSPSSRSSSVMSPRNFISDIKMALEPRVSPPLSSSSISEEEMRGYSSALERTWDMDAFLRNEEVPLNQVLAVMFTEFKRLAAKYADVKISEADLLRELTQKDQTIQDLQEALNAANEQYHLLFQQYSIVCGKFNNVRTGRNSSVRRSSKTNIIRRFAE